MEEADGQPQALSAVYLSPTGKAGSYALEFCCGSATLTAQLIKQQFDALGIDFRENRHKKKARVTDIDLATGAGRARALALLEEPRLSFVFWGPPCGTASRAREKRIPRAWKAEGYPEPKPLRSTLHPGGLPTLNHLQQLRVGKANAVYELCAEVAKLCHHRGVPFAIENPQRSLFWHMPCIQGLEPLEGSGDITFHNCSWGGRRPKRTTLRCFPVKAFEALRKACPGVGPDHTHDPWSTKGIFHAAEEAEYPVTLAAQIAQCAVAAAEATGRWVPHEAKACHTGAIAAERAAAGRQARGDALPPLIRDFKSIELVPCTGQLPQEVRNNIKVWAKDSLQIGGRSFPAGSKILQVKESEKVEVPGPAMSPPTRLAFSSLQPGIMPPDAIYIGRRYNRKGWDLAASPWANPHPLKQFRSREACLDAFRRHFASESMAAVRQSLKHLAGKRLVCPACALDQWCHGDIVIEEFIKMVLQAEEQGAAAVVEIGIPFSEEEFVQEALVLEHPFDKIELPDQISKNIATLLTKGPQWVSDFRSRQLARWSERAAALEQEEEVLRAGMHPSVRASASSKRLLLFKEMLIDSGFPNAESLVTHMAQGFRIGGKVVATGIFPQHKREAWLSMEEALDGAPLHNRHVLSSSGPSGDAKLDEEVFAETQSEHQRGWITGPFTATELDKEFQGKWICNRRFGIRQNGGTRVIDDYSESQLNATTDVTERIDVGGVDTIVAVAKGLLAAARGKGEVRVPLKSGEVLSGPMHPAFRAGVSIKLQGKVFDLSKAYRRLARAPESENVAIVAVWNPQAQRVELYKQLVMPFGATSVVYHFNWVARALWWVVVTQLAALTTHYFDDFTNLEISQLCSGTDRQVAQLFELLGWELKEHLPFSEDFAVLGVVCDLGSSDEGTLRVRNKPSRIEELTETVQAILAAGRLQQPLARSLRGKYAFAGSQTFGKIGALPLGVLGRFAEGPRRLGPIPADVASALRWLCGCLATAVPRTINVGGGAPVIVFTDGACEPIAGGGLNASVGGVLVDPALNERLCFGSEIPPEVIQALKLEQSAQIIGQAELLPVWLAKLVWSRHLAGRKVIYFIDNNSARFAMIRGTSPNSASARIVEQAWSLDASLGSSSWYARVPSPSNCSDGPSRGDFTQKQLIGRRQIAELDDAWKVVLQKLGEQ